MSLSALTVWEVRTNGADVNGGGYRSDAGNTDYSQQAAPQVAVTDAVTDGTTTISSTNATFESVMIGNLIYIAGGTGSITGAWYEVITRVSPTIITVDRSTGLTTGTGATLNLGGALGSPGILSDLMSVSGMDAHVKSGTYTLTTTTPGSDGPMHLANHLRLRISGYETTREDYGAKPVMDVGAQTSFTVVVTDGHFNDFIQVVQNIKVDGQTNAGVVGFDSTHQFQADTYDNCEAVDCVTGFDNGSCTCQECVASGCSGWGFDAVKGLVRGCEAFNCTSGGFNLLSGIGGNVQNCLAHDNTGPGFFVATYTSGSGATNCTAWNNGSHGFDLSFDMSKVSGCLAVGNGGYGFDTVDSEQLMINCAGYDNTSGNVKNTPNHWPFIDLTADPFVNSAADDFRPNNTAGGGADLRAADGGIPSQTNNNDIGAVQHADPAGGGGPPLILTRRNTLIGR